MFTALHCSYTCIINAVYHNDIIDYYLSSCDVVRSVYVHGSQRSGRQDERKPGDECQIPHQTENALVGHRRSLVTFRAFQGLGDASVWWGRVSLPATDVWEERGSRLTTDIDWCSWSSPSPSVTTGLVKTVRLTADPRRCGDESMTVSQRRSRRQPRMLSLVLRFEVWVLVNTSTPTVAI